MNVIDPKIETAAESGSKDDTWVPTSCSLCYGSCSILAHRVDGTVIKLEGNPASAVGKGRMCGKGVSGLMTHYDPHRLKVPLRRTNPEKGMGVDPKWKEITWEEALAEITENLVRIRADDPRKVVFQRTTTVMAGRVPMQSFSTGYGSNNFSTAGGGLHCGNGAHLISGVMHASWGILPDFQYCNYAIYFGASKGHSAGHASTSNMAMAADARVRGMKMVVVDPMCNFASAKASEWVPLRVGTDAALALAMCNEIANELKILDLPYLRSKTNGPYLIGPDGRYLRDGATNKPCVWDSATASARPFNEPDPENMALEGEFTVDGVTYRPSFALLREHLRKFTADWAEDLSTVPAETIRRLAAEFAEEARVGSTIVVDGVVLPYRPAAAIAFRGNQGHKNSVYNFLAVDLLNHLVGAADVVGSCIGYPAVCYGHPESDGPHWVPKADEDGLMVVDQWMSFHLPYPYDDPKVPRQMGLQELFPMGMTSPFLDSDDREELWTKFELPYRPEMLINFGANLLMSIANKDTMAASLATYKFIVSFDLFKTETSDFVDILLPDCSYLQTLDARSNYPTILSHPAGMGDWSWPIRQPVLPPDGEQRRFADVLLELAERVGFLPDMLAAFNAICRLKPPYRLDVEKKYTYAEMCEAELKFNFGPEKGLDWFKENGLASWPKKPEEVYWRPFLDVRVPVYWEWMLDIGEKIAAIAEPRGLEIPREYYQPMPDFLPCPSHQCEHGEFDLYAFYYRDTLHTNSFTMENPWLDEAARLDPFSYTIALNAGIGAAKGIADGDVIRVESETGRRVEGVVRLTEAIHPEGLGVAALCGHWADTLPVAKGKGVFFNDLLELDWHHTSPVNLNLDLCAKVKVSKVEDRA
jgi:molybdopterin-containing oxidoreductase family molybdopterin binding subunit